LHKPAEVLVNCVLLGFWQQQAPPPSCKPLTYFGVQGCELSGQGKCLKGYHKQRACPTRPLMKAPCRLVCVPDNTKKRDDVKVTDTCLKR
jgi:hypothetical protein